MSESLPEEQKLDPQIKQKWLEALRGGAYDQGTGQLCEKGYRSETYSWCCLGVLAHVLGVDSKDLVDKDTLTAINRDDLLGPWNESGKPHAPFFADNPESLTTIQRKLAAMNDTGESFPEIANWIEANL